MNPTPDADARWARMRRLFAEAMEQPPAAREAFVEAACADDPALCDELRSLLACTDTADAYFEAPSGLAGLVRDLAPGAPLAEPEAETRIGPYAITRPLGRGGMGTVFLAERADGAFEKHVALKRIRRGLDTDDVLRRFDHERHVLARLDHPGIARLLDGGTAEDGRPYFVMEYVEGEAITDFCNRQRLTVEARLMLFLQVCEAVQYAHQNLVVHRDLKPSNILVTGDGQVKLLDFGIARVLASDEGAEQTRTGDSLRPFTPAYAAPEQIVGGPITTATDVYALGVVLYELLTGHRPFDLQKAAETAARRPSTVVLHPVRQRSEGGETGEISAERASAARGTSPEKLQRRLSGDLDTIALKALRPEPEHRYPSVEAFADDLRRHLDGRPVRARGDARAYRTARFLRRHRWSVGVAAAFLLLLVGFSAVTFAQQRRAERARDRAEQVGALLKDLFREANPRSASAEAVTVEDVLKRGAATLEADAALASDVRAELLDLIGTIHSDLGAYDEARAVLEKALALYEGQSDRIGYGRSLTHLGTVYGLEGRTDTAEVILERAVATLRATRDEDAQAEALNELGEVLIDQGDYPRAESLLVQSAGLARKLWGAQSNDYATALLDMGLLYNKWGKYDTAEVHMREALDLKRQALGPEHLDVATAENVLAALLYRVGKLDEAETLHEHVLAVRRRRLPADHPEIATALNNLGNVLRERGRLDEAAAAMEESYRIQQTALGPEAPNTVITQYNLALIHFARKDLAEAERQVRRSLDLHRRVWPGTHPYTAFPLTVLGQVLLDQNRPAEAVPYLREALALRRETIGADNWLTANALGAAFGRTGRTREAEPLLVEGYEGIRAVRGDDDRHTQQALRHLVAFYEQQGQAQQAARYRALLR